MEMSKICFLSKNLTVSVLISYSLKVKQSIKVFSSWLRLQLPNRLWQLFQIFHQILSPIQEKWPLLLQVCAMSFWAFYSCRASLAVMKLSSTRLTLMMMILEKYPIKTSYPITSTFWLVDFGVSVRNAFSSDLWLWGLYRLSELLFLLIMKYIFWVVMHTNGRKYLMYPPEEEIQLLKWHFICLFGFVYFRENNCIDDKCLKWGFCCRYSISKQNVIKLEIYMI